MIERNLLTSVGYTRRDFMKVIATATAAMGLSYSMSEQVAEAAANPDNRPPVIWLHFQECTGCSESLLRTNHPGIAELILDIINLEYQETLMAGAGHQAEESLKKAMEKYAGKYVLVVEGAISKLQDGKTCMIGGRTAIEIMKDCAAKAAYVIAIGSCASNGGIVAIEPNPTQASGIQEYIPAGKPYISLPGCPPNPFNILSVILYLITFKALPEMDATNRPVFAYGRLIHEHCERRAHFNEGRFVREYGDEAHKLGYCLYHMGCKGPETYANCSIIHFNNGSAWPIGNGCPCIGCTEGDVLFKSSIFSLAQVGIPVPNSIPPTASPQGLGKHATATQGGFIGAAVGLAAGAAAMYAAKLPKEPEDENK